MPESSNVDQTLMLRLQEAQKSKVQSEAPVTGTVDGGGGGPHFDGMEARLAKLEGAFDVFKVLVSVLVAVTLAGFTFLGTQQIRLANQVDVLNAKVDALPDRINANLRDITRTLAESITAAKQTPPQVLLIPTPLPAPSPAQPNP